MANKLVLFTVMSVALTIIFAASTDGRQILQVEESKQDGAGYGRGTSSATETVGEEKAAEKPEFHTSHNVPSECYQPDGTLYCCFDAPDACIHEEGFCNYNDSPCAGR